jgi:uncharacterized protein (TIGR00369 family)
MPWLPGIRSAFFTPPKGAMDDIRTVSTSWTDPRTALPSLASLGGLEYLTRVMEGSLPAPPMAAVLGFEILEVQPGLAVFTYRPQEAHLNPLGVIHGGLACTLLDTALGCAAHTTLPAGTSYTSIEIDVKYFRSMAPGDAPVTATARVMKAGRRVIFAQGEITNSAGDALAAATSSFLVTAPGGPGRP